jgi:uncharacterized protein (TIGR02001 family)
MFHHSKKEQGQGSSERGCGDSSTLLRKLFLVLMILYCIEAHAEEAEEKEKWHAPFGGTFNAAFTVTSEYSYAGISNTARQPAAQMNFDYRSPDLLDEPKTWLYLSSFMSNVVLPAGPGLEIDAIGGVKFKLTERLRLDLGYVRVTYPGFSSDLGYDYGDFSVNVDYDFGPATLNARLRFSPNSFGNSGWEWNKRGLLSVPLDFLRLTDTAKFKAYGALGNLSVERYLQYGLPSGDYWYWQLGLVTSAFGLDLTVAYTDTSIDTAGCNYTHYCDGRVFFSVTKAF